jgi:hypothetical protein
MEFFYSGRGVASIVDWDCLVHTSIYTYGCFLCVDLTIMFHYYIEFSVWLFCVHVCDRLVCR